MEKIYQYILADLANFDSLHTLDNFSFTVGNYNNKF